MQEEFKIREQASTRWVERNLEVIEGKRVGNRAARAVVVVSEINTNVSVNVVE